MCTRRGLVVFGDPRTLSGDRHWRDFVRWCDERGCVVASGDAAEAWVTRPRPPPPPAAAARLGNPTLADAFGVASVVSAAAPSPPLVVSPLVATVAPAWSSTPAPSDDSAGVVRAEEETTHTLE